jgi:2-(1,2-epoxy-1,2-dihydrophenyl)acetyl-CoA isomerase
VEWSIGDGIGRIVLNRPDQANALSEAVFVLLVRAVDELLEAKPRVLLLSARGRYFSCGGDINEFIAVGDGLPRLADVNLRAINPVLERLASAPMPIVSALNGPVAGGAIGLALCADFVLGCPSVKLRGGYAAIGISPDVGASYFLARRVGAVRAQQWFMLNETIDAARCLATGVIDALHPDEELAAAAEALVARLAQAAPRSMAAIKTLHHGFARRSMAEHLELERELVVGLTGTADAREGVRAFMDKRPPRFIGA